MHRTGEKTGGRKINSKFVDDFSCIVAYNTGIMDNKWRMSSLKKLNDAIDRFCATHRGWAIPGLMRYIVGANAAFFILSMFAGAGTLEFLSLNAAAVLRGELWRVVTYVLLPMDSGILLLISLLFYYWLGGSLERMWGSAKFTFYYISGTLLTALGAILAYLIDGVSFSISGAVYVNMAMFFAYALSFPEQRVYLFYVIPVKMKWMAILEGVYFAYSVLIYATSGLWGMALMPLIAIFNFFVFFAPDFRRSVDRVTARNRPQAIEYRKAVKEQQRSKGYNHKCTVCGRTDTDHPQLQFRYCSKCAGYHCYCEEHIFNHQHFTE